MTVASSIVARVDCGRAVMSKPSRELGKLLEGRNMNVRRIAVGFLLVVGLSWLLAGTASAAMARPFWRHRQNYRAPAAAAAPSAQTGMTARVGRNSYAGAWRLERQ